MSEGFEPTDFYALTSAYGTGEQLKRLLKKMRRAGLKGSVEVVLNRISGKRLDDHVSWKASGDSVDAVRHAIRVSLPPLIMDGSGMS